MRPVDPDFICLIVQSREASSLSSLQAEEYPYGRSLREEGREDLKAYGRNWESLEGTPYQWGDQTPLGIVA